jgi:hypothetical protein
MKVVTQTSREQPDELKVAQLTRHTGQPRRAPCPAAEPAAGPALQSLAQPPLPCQPGQPAPDPGRRRPLLAPPQAGQTPPSTVSQRPSGARAGPGTREARATHEDPVRRETGAATAPCKWVLPWLASRPARAASTCKATCFLAARNAPGPAKVHALGPASPKEFAGLRPVRLTSHAGCKGEGRG